MVESRNLSKMSNDQVHQSAKVVVCHLKSLHLKNRDCPHLKITRTDGRTVMTNVDRKHKTRYVRQRIAQTQINILGLISNQLVLFKLQS